MLDNIKFTPVITENLATFPKTDGQLIVDLTDNKLAVDINGERVIVINPDSKQDKLVAGNNISLNNNIISADEQELEITGLLVEDSTTESGYRVEISTADTAKVKAALIQEELKIKIILTIVETASTNAASYAKYIFKPTNFEHYDNDYTTRFSCVLDELTLYLDFDFNDSNSEWTFILHYNSYNDLEDTPMINGHTLYGEDQSGESLGLQNKLTAGLGIDLANNIISKADSPVITITTEQIRSLDPIKAELTEEQAAIITNTKVKSIWMYTPETIIGGLKLLFKRETLNKEETAWIFSATDDSPVVYTITYDIASRYATYVEHPMQEKLTAGDNITIDSGYTISATVPTKTSQLTNDANFVTINYHDSTKQNELAAGNNISITQGAAESFSPDNIEIINKIYVNPFLSLEEIAGAITELIGSTTSGSINIMYTSTVGNYYITAEISGAPPIVVNYALKFNNITFCSITRGVDGKYSGGWQNISSTDKSFSLGMSADLHPYTNKMSLWNGILIGKTQFVNKPSISAIVPSNIPISASVKTIWTGTQAQYDAIATKDPNTLYIITEA